jgi:zinc transport system substrate-binding protein
MTDQQVSNRRETDMRLISPLLVLTMPMTARADVPKVVTDIEPIHSLVAQVMSGVGVPDVLISGAASPHDFQFTFVQAEAVQDADLVIWVGADLTPWLGEALETLTTSDNEFELLASENWPSLERRDWGDDHDDHGHDDHGDGDDDDDSILDPHAWLNPQVAMVWTRHIAFALRNLNPENEAADLANADATVARLVKLDQEIAAQMADLPRGGILVPHDAYQYFGQRYDVPAVGTISLSEDGISCVLSDPQTRREWVDLVRDGKPCAHCHRRPHGHGICTGTRPLRTDCACGSCGLRAVFGRLKRLGAKTPLAAAQVFGPCQEMVQDHGVNVSRSCYRISIALRRPRLQSRL